MRMGLGLGLNQQQGGGPYSAYVAAYDFSAATNYLLNTGKIETAYNLGSGGSGYDATQSVSGDRPTIGAMLDASNGAVFSGTTTEWIRADSIGASLNDGTAKRLVEIVFQPNDFAADRVLCSWKGAGFTYESININCRITTGYIRIRRRGFAVGADKVTDCTVAATAGAVNVLSLLFDGGLVTGYLNGVLCFNADDWITGTGTTQCNRFALGAFLDPTLVAPTSGFDGYVRSFALREYP